MSYSIRADTNGLQYPFLVDVTDCLPAVIPFLRSTNRAMDKIQVNVSKATGSNRPFDRFFDIFVTIVDLELSRVKDFRARGAGGFAEV